MGTTSFPSLGLSDWLVGQVNAVGIKDPTPVQANCIPPILEGQLNCSCSYSQVTMHQCLVIPTPCTVYTAPNIYCREPNKDQIIQPYTIHTDPPSPFHQYYTVQVNICNYSYMYILCTQVETVLGALRLAVGRQLPLPSPFSTDYQRTRMESLL